MTMMMIMWGQSIAAEDVVDINEDVCYTDGEQLVEPEFAGLWDKQPAFQPVRGSTLTTDETPRAKTCKASKMEQVRQLLTFLPCVIFVTDWHIH